MPLSFMKSNYRQRAQNNKMKIMERSCSVFPSVSLKFKKKKKPEEKKNRIIFWKISSTVDDEKTTEKYSQETWVLKFSQCCSQRKNAFPLEEVNVHRAQSPLKKLLLPNFHSFIESSIRGYLDVQVGKPITARNNIKISSFTRFLKSARRFQLILSLFPLLDPCAWCVYEMDFFAHHKKFSFTLIC